MRIAKLIFEVLIAIPIFAILVYVIVRVIASAWFRTKQQFNNNKPYKKEGEL
jgi:hypothetical protein